MRYLLVLLIVCCGCAPKIKAAGPRSVTVTRFLSNDAAAQKVADAHCAQYNRFARVMQNEGRGTIIYDCVE